MRASRVSFGIVPGRVDDLLVCTRSYSYYRPLHRGGRHAGTCRHLPALRRLRFAALKPTQWQGFRSLAHQKDKCTTWNLAFPQSKRYLRSLRISIRERNTNTRVSMYCTYTTRFCHEANLLQVKLLKFCEVFNSNNIPQMDGPKKSLHKI